MDGARNSVPLQSFPEALHDLLRSELDLDASGDVGFSDVRTMVAAYKTEKQRISFLKWLIVGGGVVLVFMSAATFGVSFAAAELAKEVEPNAHGVMTVRSSGAPMLSSEYTMSGTELVTTSNRRLQLANTSTDGFHVHLMDMGKTTQRQACSAYAQGAASELNMHMAGGVHHFSIDLVQDNCMVGQAVYARQAIDWTLECPTGSDVCHVYTATVPQQHPRGELRDTPPSSGPGYEVHGNSNRRLGFGVPFVPLPFVPVQRQYVGIDPSLPVYHERRWMSWFTGETSYMPVSYVTIAVLNLPTKYTSFRSGYVQQDVWENKEEGRYVVQRECYPWLSPLCGSNKADCVEDSYDINPHGVVPIIKHYCAHYECCVTSVICTYMHDVGRITQEEWEVSQAAGGDLPELVYRGYRYWADVTVGDLNALQGMPKEQMEMEMVWEYFVKSYLKQIAWFKRHPVGEFNLMGSAMMLAGYPVCGILGLLQHLFPTLMALVQVEIARIIGHVAATVYFVSQVPSTSALAVSSVFMFAVRITRIGKTT